MNNNGLATITDPIMAKYRQFRDYAQKSANEADWPNIVIATSAVAGVSALAGATVYSIWKGW